MKKVTIPPSCIHTIDVEGELMHGIYGIEEFSQDFP